MLGASVLGACSLSELSEKDPHPVTVTFQFPSTQAAIATDFLQLYLFDVRSEADRERLCLEKLLDRSKGVDLAADAVPPPWNLCELFAGKRAVEVPYGERAILAVAQRRVDQGKLEDVLIGCSVQAVGPDEPLAPIALTLVDVMKPLPTTTCTSVELWCGGFCQ